VAFKNVKLRFYASRSLRLRTASIASDGGANSCAQSFAFLAVRSLSAHSFAFLAFSARNACADTRVHAAEEYTARCESRT
jgi:hypothetical protein